MVVTNVGKLAQRLNRNTLCDLDDICRYSNRFRRLKRKLK
jgi:hypothetical protein